MISPADLAAQVLHDLTLQENHWLEWKSHVDLAERSWQARIARFILGAANRPADLAASSHQGHAFMLLGVEPGAAPGTKTIDPAAVDSGLRRYLGNAGPGYTLDYVTVDEATAAVITVHPTPAGSRPYLARGTFSGTKPVIQDGRIYIRRAGSTDEATAVEVDDMLAERVGVRVAAGPRWPLKAVDAWRDGKTIHVRQERGDQIIVHSYDAYSNLVDMATERPSLPINVPQFITARVNAALDPFLQLAEEDAPRAVDNAWPEIRQITIEVYRKLLEREPPHKVIDMTSELANGGHLDGDWINVAYLLYYWPITQEQEGMLITSGDGKTYLLLAKAFATALLLAAESESRQGPST